MNPLARSSTRVVACAVLATAALILAPATHATTHPRFTPLQPTAATAPCGAVALPVPAGWQGGVVDIDDAGVLVGSVLDPDNVLHATYWTPSSSAPSGFVRHTPNLPAAGELLDVNSSGVAVGFDEDNGQGFVLDTTTGAFRYLPDLAGGRSDRPRRINRSGVIAGAAADQNGTWLATTWAPPYDKAHAVGVPGEQQLTTWTDPDGNVFTWIAGSEADGINNAGTTAVFAALPDPHVMRAQGHSPFSADPGSDQPVDVSTVQVVPMTKTASGRVQILQTTGDMAYSFALNDTGTVVGDDITDLDSFDTRPVYWVGSAEHDLGEPADAQGGRALNIDRSWITGFLYYGDGTTRGYVWTGGGLLQAVPDLPGFPGGTMTHGVDQTQHEVAGLAFAADGSHVPVVWRCSAGFSTAG
ncbi:hypothetical protein [Nocardioides maradonensis]